MMDLVCILMGSLGTDTVQRNKWCGKLEWLIERENWFGCYEYLNASIEDLFIPSLFTQSLCSYLRIPRCVIFWPGFESNAHHHASARLCV